MENGMQWILSLVGQWHGLSRKDTGLGHNFGQEIVKEKHKNVGSRLAQDIWREQ